MTLLRRQLDSVARAHRCLSLQILRGEQRLPWIGFRQLDRPAAEAFHRSYVANDSLFNYPNLFAATEFLKPKGDGGVRRFHFLEWHARVLYYSVGYFVLELTDGWASVVRPIARRNKIETYYGARVRFDDPGRSEIHYQRDYQLFTGGIRRFLRRRVQEGHTVALLHMDVQDFFNSISHATLVEVIAQQALPAARLRMQYDSAAKSTLRDILALVMGAPSGLPLSRHNIVSNLLADFYMWPVDRYVNQLQLEAPGEVRFSRYVDDMFLMRSFPMLRRSESIGEEMYRACTRLGSEMALKLGLSLNPLKTRLNVCSSEDDLDGLIEKSRLVSFYEPLPEDDNEPPRNALVRALKIVEELQATFAREGTVPPMQVNDDLALKRVFHNAVVQYARSPVARAAIGRAFTGFNPTLLPRAMKPLLFLISQVPGALRRLYDYTVEALSSDEPPLVSLHLAELLMLLPEYGGELRGSVEAAARNGSSPNLRLLSRLVVPEPPAAATYLPLSPGEGASAAFYQVRRAIICERFGEYNVAFNHLLNAFHEQCFVLDPNAGERKNYNRTSVANWLQSLVGLDDVALAISAFDRRNSNEISHPGRQGLEVRAVDEPEYRMYRRRLARLLVRVHSAI